MLIGFEASALQGHKSGVGYYTENVLGSVMRAAPQHRYVLFSNRDMGESWARLGGERVCDRFFPVRALWMQTVLPLALRDMRPQVCHYTNYLAPLVTGCPSVVTIHDMTVFITPRFHRFKKLVLDRTLIPKVARRADAIITVSNSARNDIVRHLKVNPQKVRVVMNAVSDQFRPVTDPAQKDGVKARYGLHTPFFLYVGTIEPRKNIGRLICAFAQLKKRGLSHKLVIVGQEGWYCAPIFAEVERLGLKNEVIFTGYVPSEDLSTLYSLAEAMAFPSLYEGFGLPVLEAMACGTPVVTSRTSSLAEVAGGAALLVDPLSEDEIAEALYLIHKDSALQADLGSRGITRASQFTWEKTARATLEVYEGVVAGRRVGDEGRRTNETIQSPIVSRQLRSRQSSVVSRQSPPTADD